MSAEWKGCNATSRAKSCTRHVWHCPCGQRFDRNGYNMFGGWSFPHQWEHVMLEMVERQRAEAKKLELDVLARDARCRGHVT